MTPSRCSGQVGARSLTQKGRIVRPAGRGLGPAQDFLERAFVVRQTQFAQTPGAQIAGVADRAAEESALFVDDETEEAEGQRRVACGNGADGGARPDIDRDDAPSGRARAKVAGRAVADRGINGQVVALYLVAKRAELRTR